MENLKQEAELLRKVAEAQAEETAEAYAGGATQAGKTVQGYGRKQLLVDVAASQAYRWNERVSKLNRIVGILIEHPEFEQYIELNKLMQEVGL